MPDFTDDDLAQSALEPESASVDGQSAKSHPLPDQIAARRYLAGGSALDGTSADGGPRSAFGCLRPAKVVPPGAY